jgi:hypothetical protein
MKSVNVRELARMGFDWFRWEKGIDSKQSDPESLSSEMTMAM